MFFIVNCIIILITLLLVFLCLDAANLCERDLQEARVVIGFSVSFILYLFFNYLSFFFIIFKVGGAGVVSGPLIYWEPLAK